VLTIRGLLLIPPVLALAWLALSPAAQAVCREGCDTDNNDTFLGDDALLNNTDGFGNTAIGFNALESNTTANFNTATGYSALEKNTSGHDNTALGHQALAASTGSSNLALGSGAGASLTTGSNNVDIANPGVAGESGQIRIGTAGKQTAAFLQGVYGSSIAGPVKTVVVNASGRLGTAALAASAQSKRASSALSAAAGRRLLATVKRLQQENERQGKEIRTLRAQN